MYFIIKYFIITENDKKHNDNQPDVNESENYIEIYEVSTDDKHIGKLIMNFHNHAFITHADKQFIILLRGSNWHKTANSGVKKKRPLRSSGCNWLIR